MIGDGSCNCDDCCEDLPSGCVIPDDECNDTGDCSDTCPSFESDKCQDPDTNDASLSDGKMARIADNFIPDSNDSVTKVIFFGAYVLSGTPVVDLPTPSDSIQITYYDDDGGLPGKVIGGPFIQDDEDVPLTLEAKEETGVLVADAAAMFLYEVAHSAVSVKADKQYWIEIVNVSSDGMSQWFWVPSVDGDLMAAVDGPPLPWNGYEIEEGIDQAFCLNIPFNTDDRRQLGKEGFGTKNSITLYLNA